jgi:hypothetical protein
MDNQRWSHRTKDLDDLEVGTAVAIQNQTGPNPTKWDKTGISKGDDQSRREQACHHEEQEVCEANGDYSDDHYETSTSEEETSNTANYQTRTAEENPTEQST